MKNLELMGVQEMNAIEITNVDGGYWQAVLAIAGAGIYAYNNWGDFCAGFSDGFN